MNHWALLVDLNPGAPVASGLGTRLKSSGTGVGVLGQNSLFCSYWTNPVVVGRERNWHVDMLR